MHPCVAAVQCSAKYGGTYSQAVTLLFSVHSIIEPYQNCLSASVVDPWGNSAWHGGSEIRRKKGTEGV